MKILKLIEGHIKPACITVLAISIALLIGTMDGADAGVVKELPIGIYIGWGYYETAEGRCSCRRFVTGCT